MCYEYHILRSFTINTEKKIVQVEYAFAEIFWKLCHSYVKFNFLELFYLLYITFNFQFTEICLVL